MRPKPGEHYTHYKKWGTYEIVCLAKDQETLKDMVVYRALYRVTDLGEAFSHDPIFIRTLENFTEVFPDCIQRFTEVR